MIALLAVGSSLGYLLVSYAVAVCMQAWDTNEGNGKTRYRLSRGRFWGWFVLWPLGLAALIVLGPPVLVGYGLYLATRGLGRKLSGGTAKLVLKLNPQLEGPWK